MVSECSLIHMFLEGRYKVVTRPDDKKAFRVQPDRTASKRLGLWNVYTHTQGFY